MRMVSCEHLSDLRPEDSSRRRCAASLQLVTSGPARSSAWRLLLAKGLLWSRLFIAIWVLLGRSDKGVFRFPGCYYRAVRVVGRISVFLENLLPNSGPHIAGP